ncbi:MAG: chlorophyll synthesis pathway protein BchC [Marivibrio sp.]|uniref:chlorophyll synthesis pathway protein BchC n=1 Tax=Marivibrio sp. TaxID=2039719 RepID=UPI0032EAF901
MQAQAVVFHEPKRLSVETLDLTAPGPADAVVEIAHSGVSTGTERLLWSGEMPPFPGMGYPLVPGYESVGEVVEAGPESGLSVGQTVFVPGATCYGEVRGLFGGTAQRLITAGARTAPVDKSLGRDGVLMALAATAQHAIAGGAAPPDLIVGHGVLGRLIARIAVAHGGAPTVWETNPVRQSGAEGYQVVHPDEDERRDYKAICDVSGDGSLLDSLIGRLAPQGEVILAGFYKAPLSFTFPPAFIREARLRVAAEWRRPDLDAVSALVSDGRLALDGLLTHHRPANEAGEAYRTAFEDPACLKMVLDWRDAS